MIDKDKLKRRFTRSAKTYDQYARVQKLMGNHMLADIQHIKPLTILEIGSGTGYVTERLASQFPEAHITAIDIAEGMIALASEKPALKGVQFICGDFESLENLNTYDLIISNATIQWFNDLPAALQKMSGLLNQNGSLCLTTFGSGTFKELHEVYQQVPTLENTFAEPGQRFLSLQTFENTLTDVFSQSCITLDSDTHEEYFDQCLSFFESIKKIGANNANQGKTVKDPNFIHRVMAYYDAHYKTEKGVVATYECLYARIE